ncbi:hypothetical protein E2P81_ATG03597 [Venturia nashicola]|nr:hypothetical protein E2P81_ATG03597 [Venturia nashicola]
MSPYIAVAEDGVIVRCAGFFSNCTRESAAQTIQGDLVLKLPTRGVLRNIRPVFGAGMDLFRSLEAGMDLFLSLEAGMISSYPWKQRPSSGFACSRGLGRERMSCKAIRDWTAAAEVYLQQEEKLQRYEESLVDERCRGKNKLSSKRDSTP